MSVSGRIRCQCPNCTHSVPNRVPMANCFVFRDRIKSTFNVNSARRNHPYQIFYSSILQILRVCLGTEGKETPTWHAPEASAHHPQSKYSDTVSVSYSDTVSVSYSDTVSVSYSDTVSVSYSDTVSVSYSDT
eukprot:Polyplicarium_translucidae@DN2441_c1_g1_i2.p2